MDLQAYYRQKKRAAFFRKTGFWLVLCAVLLAAAWGAFWLPIFRITKIEIREYPDLNAVRNLINPHLAAVNGLFLPANNFFLLSEKRVQSIVQNQGLGLPEVEKQFPKTLIIEFSKPEPWLIYCKSEAECFYVDKNGVLSEKAPQWSEKPLPEISFASRSFNLGDQALEAETIKYIVEFLDWLSLSGFLPKEIEVIAERELNIFVKEGWFIKLITVSSAKAKAYDLKLLLDQQIKDNVNNLEYIDLRFDNKAFYKLR